MNLIDKILSRMHLSETKQKVVRNLFWAVTGKVVSLLGTLLVGIFVARYLGPEQYGLMNYVVSFVALFQVFASFGMDNIEIREESKCKGTGEKGRVPGAEANTILGTAFGLRLIFAGITMLAVILTAWLFEADTFTKWMITLYSLSTIMNTFGVIRNYFTSIVWNEYVVKTEISRTIIGALIKVALLLLHAPLAWFIAAALFDTVLIAGGYLLSYRKQIASPRLWTFDKTTAKYLIKESFPLLLSGAAIVVYQKIDQVMIGNMIDKASVGYYAVAESIAGVLIFIPTILSQTIMPILVQNYRVDKKQYHIKAQLFMDVTVWLCIILCVCICLLAPFLIRWLYGAQYEASIILLQVCVFKVIGYAFAQVTGTMIVTESKQKYVVVRNVVGCVFAISLNLLLLPRYGVLGAAVASVITAVITGYVSHVIIPTYRDIFHMQTRSLLKGWRNIFQVRSIFDKQNK
ncbi:MAG: flippase [Paludibacteraceae bacterium]